MPVEIESAVAHCGVENLFGFRLTDGRLVFTTKEWTTLAVNEFGDAIPFAYSSGNREGRVLMGEMALIKAYEAWLPEAAANPHPYKAWKADGNAYVPDDTARNGLSNEFNHVFLTRETGSHFVGMSTLHTVRQLSKVLAWTVTHSPQERQPQFWSRRDLSTWHLESDWYVKLEPKEWNRVWKSFRLDSYI